MATGRSAVGCFRRGRLRSSSPCCWALPVLRLKGHYFAIATPGLAQVMAAIVSNVDIAGQNIGLVLPPLNNDRLFYELSLGLLVLATLTVFWLTRSRFGFGLIAIRENEEAAAVMGVNTTLYKVLAFALSGVFTALAGGIHAYWITFIDPESAFDISLNVKMIIMAVFGGPGTVLGPVRRRLLALGDLRISVEQRSPILPACFSVSVVVAAVVLDATRPGRRDAAVPPNAAGAISPRTSASAPDMSRDPRSRARHPPLCRTCRGQRCQLRARHGRNSRRDRPERRRQDHAGQPDQRHAAADFG